MCHTRQTLQRLLQGAQRQLPHPPQHSTAQHMRGSVGHVDLLTGHWAAPAFQGKCSACHAAGDAPLQTDCLLCTALHGLRPTCVAPSLPSRASSSRGSAVLRLLRSRALKISGVDSPTCKKQGCDVCACARRTSQHIAAAYANAPRIQDMCKHTNHPALRA